MPDPKHRPLRQRRSAAAAKKPTVTNAFPTTTGTVRSNLTFGVPYSNRASERTLFARDRVMKSREINKSLSFVKNINQTLPDEALSGGLTVKSASKNEAARKLYTDYFHRWADSEAIDLRRRHNFYSIQPHLVTSSWIDGEIFVQFVADPSDRAKAFSLADRSRRRLQLQVFTRDQIQTPDSVPKDQRWIDGILFNEWDQEVEYSIMAEGETEKSKRFIRRSARDMVHLFADTRFNQFHGDPILFSAEEDSLDALDMKALRKHSAKIRAAFLGTTSTMDGNLPVALNGLQTVDPDTEQRKFVEIHGGAVMLPLKHNEQFSFYTGQEAINFGQLIEDLTSNIVHSYLYPPEYIIEVGKLGSASNRVILSRVRRAHARLRRIVQTQFCQRVWEFVIGDAISLGLLPNADDWSTITTSTGPDPSIDIGRDEKADAARLLNFTGTVEDYCDTRGQDGTSVRHGRLDEIADNIRYGAMLGLPWFLCVDPTALQAASAFASQQEAIDLLGQQLAGINTDKSTSTK